MGSETRVSAGQQTTGASFYGECQKRRSENNLEFEKCGERARIANGFMSSRLAFDYDSRGRGRLNVALLGGRQITTRTELD